MILRILLIYDGNNDISLKWNIIITTAVLFLFDDDAYRKNKGCLTWNNMDLKKKYYVLF